MTGGVTSDGTLTRSRDRFGVGNARSLRAALLTGGRRTFVSELFRRATDPWYWLVRKITPGSISDRHIPFLGLLLIVNLRLLLLPLLGA